MHWFNRNTGCIETVGNGSCAGWSHEFNRNTGCIETSIVKITIVLRPYLTVTRGVLKHKRESAGLVIALFNRNTGCIETFTV